MHGTDKTAESGMGGPVYTMWDVYSFGVLLLELFIGKKPTDGSLGEGLDLRTYVERSFPGRIEEILDPTMVLEEEENSVMDLQTCEVLVSVLGIGLTCTNESPRERMGIHHVLQQLNTNSFLISLFISENFVDGKEIVRGRWSERGHTISVVWELWMDSSKIPYSINKKKGLLENLFYPNIQSILRKLDES